MDAQTPSKGRWLAQFVFYLVVFALLISVGAYFLTDKNDAVQPAQPAAQATATPTPTAPSGLAGHDAPGAK